jgi:hypothetical protein
VLEFASLNFIYGVLDMDRALINHLRDCLVQVADPKKSLLYSLVVHVQHMPARLVKSIRDEGFSFILPTLILLTRKSKLKLALQLRD